MTTEEMETELDTLRTLVDWLQNAFEEETRKTRALTKELRAKRGRKS